MSFTDRSSPSQAIVPLFTQGLTSGTEGVPVLTFHIHPIDESPLIFSSSSPPPCPCPFTTVHFCNTLLPLAWIMISAFLLGSCPLLLLLPEPEWSHHTPPVNASVAPLYTLQGKVLTSCLCLQTKCDCISSCSTSLCIPLPLITLLQPHFFMVSIRSPSFFFFSPEAWDKSCFLFPDCSSFYLVGFSSFPSPNLLLQCDLYRERFFWAFNLKCVPLYLILFNLIIDFSECQFHHL